MKMPPSVSRLAAHVALATALSSPFSASAFSPPPAAQQIISLVETGVLRSDPSLGTAVQSLLAESPTPAPVDFAKTAGTWRVVSAPLIDTVSRLALTKFDIEYRIGADATISASVHYDSKIVGRGWLCTDGTIANVLDATSPTVTLEWLRIWWQPGGGDVPPLDPDAEGAAVLRPLVQVLGRIGFSPSLAVFPVRYVDSSGGLAVFQFQGLTVAVRRVS